MNDENELWNRHLEAVKRLVRSGATNASARHEKEDKELLNDLAQWVGNGSISVGDENQSLFDLLQTKYPIGFNQIAWNGVKDSQFFDILQMKSGQTVYYETEVHKLLQIRDTIEDLVEGARENEEARVIWFSDDCDLSLKMCMSTFLECYIILFTSPGHSYLVPEDCEWCLSYTLDGCLYFGLAENSIITGPVNVDDMDAYKH